MSGFLSVWHRSQNNRTFGDFLLEKVVFNLLVNAMENQSSVLIHKGQVSRYSWVFLFISVLQAGDFTRRYSSEYGKLYSGICFVCSVSAVSLDTSRNHVLCAKVTENERYILKSLGQKNLLSTIFSANDMLSLLYFS